MIWRETFEYPWQVAAAMLALLVSSAATLAIPYRFKEIIDRAFGDQADVAVINHSFRYLMMIVLVLGIASAMRFYFVSWLGERVVADLRLKVQTNLLRLSPGFFEENAPSEISSRMTSDTAIIEQVVGTTVSVALRNLITGLGGVILLFVLAPVQSAYLVGGAFVIALVMRLFGRRIRTIARASQDRVAEIGAKTSEVLGAMKIVQGFNQEAARGRAVPRRGRGDVRHCQAAHHAARGDHRGVHHRRVRRDHRADVGRRAERRRGQDHRRDDRRDRGRRGDGLGRVRRAVRSLCRPAARRGRGEPAQRAAQREARHRPARAAARAARAAARRARVPERHLPLSDAARDARR